MKTVFGFVAAFLVIAPAVASPSRARSTPLAGVFASRSYRPGDLAQLIVWGGSAPERVDVLRLGPGGGPVHSRRVTRVALQASRRIVVVRVGEWPSGLYAARLAVRDRIVYAPFVVRPRRLGTHRIAVVLPTNTWQAYNFRDVDGNGVGDTWYADPHVTSVDLDRPFVDDGLPPHFRSYDLGFLVWLAGRGEVADFLSDDDLERVSGHRLARLYDLIVFPGHEEYVTGRAYDALTQYRNLGGNLAFLSANNVFYSVERRGHTLARTGRWRDLGRPEARLIGVQYVDWNHARYRNRPYVVVGARRARWFFRGTGLHDGDMFGTFGIEIDARTRMSPPGAVVLARIPNVFGPGKSAEMTYYTTPRGAKVFAAGAFTLGGAARWRPMSQLLDNLWRELSTP